jgi:hypothetical protein
MEAVLSVDGVEWDGEFTCDCGRAVRYANEIVVLCGCGQGWRVDGEEPVRVGSRIE